MNTSEVLNRAADLIEERGWVHGTGWITPLTMEGASVCLEGGIQAALGLRINPSDPASYLPFRECAAYRSVAEYLDTAALFIWNDKSGRTASEVIEVLRASAVIEAARERQAVTA